MNILVTGGAGYIGSVLCEMLLENNPNWNVTVIDSLMYKQDGLLHLMNNPRLNFIYGDVRDYNLLVKWTDWADVVLHFLIHCHQLA
jgi:nucleoside-diphosphate-sugar epimerase